MQLADMPEAADASTGTHEPTWTTLEPLVATGPSITPEVLPSCVVATEIGASAQSDPLRPGRLLMRDAVPDE